MKKYFSIAVLALAFLIPTQKAHAQAIQHGVTVSWTYTQGTDLAVGFNVYRSLTTGGPYARLATLVPIATLNYFDTTGVGGTKYYYVVTAQDITGLESQYSPEANASFLLLPNAPTGVTAVAK